MLVISVGIVIGLVLETYTGWGTKLRSWAKTL